MALRLLLLLLLPAFPAAAQEVVTSSAPDSVAVTIYRAPNRSPDTDMNLGWLEGYALVTEKRTVEIPSGHAVIRFEGVAGGMLPESAMVSGLPDGVTEKNLDADLLSPGNLYARSLGRPVVLRRTHPKTGEVHEERAVIRSGPEGSVIVQTRAGFETANCGATQDQLVYGEVPPGLTARPTLSVETSSQAPARVTIALSYLAWGFDWQANYVLKMAEDGKTANMFAWVTLANSDTTSFTDAETAVVGGEVNREDAERSSAQGQSLSFRCYFSPVDEPPPPMNIAPASEEYTDEIVVTAMRVPAPPPPPPPPPPVRVQEEGLGDLRLYRVPMPTTVASMAQKQVAMFELPNVRLATYYVAEIWPRGDSRVEVVRHLRMRNLEKEGLGRALPAGQAVIFEPFESSPILSGEGILSDTAVGQKVDIAIGEAPPVTAMMETLGSSDQQDNSKSDWQDYRLTARNANPWPVQFEARLRHDSENRIEKLTVKARSIESLATLTTWRVTIPANGTATLGWRQSRITPP
jgi:hypothetical protein